MFVRVRVPLMLHPPLVTHVSSRDLCLLMFSMFGSGSVRPRQFFSIWLTAVRFEPNFENISAFPISDNETTSTATSWTLFGLCQNLEARRKIRGELLALITDDPMMDELQSLPYLDMVVRSVYLEESRCQEYGLADEE